MNNIFSLPGMNETAETRTFADKPSELTVEDLAILYLLDGLKGFGPKKFKSIWDSGLDPIAVYRDPKLLPTKGKNGDKLRDALRTAPETSLDVCRRRAERQIETARKLGATILSYRHPSYPKNLLNSAHPVPILYARGNLSVLSNQKTVACVGSRKIRAPYISLHEKFCAASISKGFSITSGFALGADSIGHRAAHLFGGYTVCVMPGGLDRPFPPENRPLWDSLLESNVAAFVSEFAFNTSASALTLRKRNKTIVSLSLGVLVSQSSRTGGAMNAFRFGIEQKKPISTFSSDGNEDTTGNREIANEKKVSIQVFPTDSTNSGGYDLWLGQLSSLI